MSTCPEKELLSAYIDNEISSPWSDDIREHLKTCPRCEKQLRRYGRTKELLAQDAALDRDELDESFKRLEARMSYKKVVTEADSGFSSLFFRRIVPAMAAGAVFALVLPAQLAKNSIQNQTATGIRRSAVQPLPKNAGIISDGTMSHAELASMISGTPATHMNLTLQNVPLSAVDNEPTILTRKKPFVYIKLGGLASYDEKSVLEPVENFTYMPEIPY